MQTTRVGVSRPGGRRAPAVESHANGGRRPGGAGGPEALLLAGFGLVGGMAVVGMAIGALAGGAGLGGLLPGGRPRRGVLVSVGVLSRGTPSSRM